MKEPHRGSARSSRAEAGRFAGYGLSWFLTMLLLGWGGLALDRRLETIPLFLVLGILLGFASGLITIYARAVATPSGQTQKRVDSLHSPGERR